MKNSRAVKFILLVIMTIIMAMAIAGLELYRFAHRPSVRKTTILLVNPGDSLQKVSRQLEKSGLVSSARKFSLIVRIRGLANRIQAGEYEFQTGETPLDIIEQLITGQVKTYQITIPEGFTMEEIGDLLAERACGKNEFNHLVVDRKFMQPWKIEAPNCEGYLFPSTYHYSRNTGCRQLLSLMLKTFTDQYKIISDRVTKPSSYSRHELVILASIVQKEAGNEEEMPIIAAVIFNRLQKGMRLQCDPTVIYGLGKRFDGNLRRKDLKDSSPYNTYRHRGLPPGPICNPGASALRAVNFPASVDYLYFVSRNNGSHQFSSTLKEHNQAVNRFQKRGR
ncbi:MAG: endolytic transglycosylase MltG [Pseudomonadota bacterium]|nr:endolytic transglycosylase MltG [Pseudomonadota bacterium]